MLIVILLIVTVFVLTVLKIFSTDVKNDTDAEDTLTEECDEDSGS